MEMEQYKLAENINKLAEILCNQQGSTYIFYKDTSANNDWEKYIWAEHTPSGELCFCHYAEGSAVIVSTYVKYNSDTYKDYLKYYTKITMDDFMHGIQQLIIALLNENNDLKSAQKAQKFKEEVKFTDEQFVKLIDKLYSLRAEATSEMEQLKETIDDELYQIIDSVEDIVNKEE